MWEPEEKQKPAVSSEAFHRMVKTYAAGAPPSQRYLFVRRLAETELYQMDCPPALTEGSWREWHNRSLRHYVFLERVRTGEIEPEARIREEVEGFYRLMEKKAN
jgi:hypothetical protein